MENKKAMTKKEMVQLYKDYNVLAPSDQALGRFAKMMGYNRTRVMKSGKTEIWYIQKEN